MSDTKELFTPEGREKIKNHLPPEYLTCEFGFLDSIEGVPVTDEDAVKILLERNRNVGFLETATLTDHLEIALEKVLMHQKWGTEKFLFQYKEEFEQLLMALKNSREKAGRQLPTF